MKRGQESNKTSTQAEKRQNFERWVILQLLLFDICEKLKQISICAGVFNTQCTHEHSNKTSKFPVHLTHSALVFIFYFLCCYLIWAPQRACTSSGSFVLQMEPFCSTCWLTFYPKLTEHFSLVPEHIMEWSVSLRQFWTKLKVVYSWIYCFPFVLCAALHMPPSSDPATSKKKEKFILLLLAGFLGNEYETQQENRDLLLVFLMHYL